MYSECVILVYLITLHVYQRNDNYNWYTSCYSECRGVRSCGCRDSEIMTEEVFILAAHALPCQWMEGRISLVYNDRVWLSLLFQPVYQQFAFQGPISVFSSWHMFSLTGGDRYFCGKLQKVFNSTAVIGTWELICHRSWEIVWTPSQRPKLERCQVSGKVPELCCSQRQGGLLALFVLH